MKKRKIIILISIIVVLAAAAIVYKIFVSEKNAEITWVTVKPQKGDIQNLVTATGTLNALKTVLVGTQVSGVISKIYVDFNDIVKQGQVIALLDTRSLKVSLDEARANLSKSQAQLVQIKAEYDRNLILYDQRLIAKSDLDIQTSNYKTAENTVLTSESEVSKALINLKSKS